MEPIGIIVFCGNGNGFTLQLVNESVQYLVKGNHWVAVDTISKFIRNFGYFHNFAKLLLLFVLPARVKAVAREDWNTKCCCNHQRSQERCAIKHAGISHGSCSLGGPAPVVFGSNSCNSDRLLNICIMGSMGLEQIGNLIGVSAPSRFYRKAHLFGCLARCTHSSGQGTGRITLGFVICAKWILSSAQFPLKIATTWRIFLEIQIEALEVERAFVHLDFESTSQTGTRPRWYSLQSFTF